MPADNALLESRAGYLVPLNKLPAERQRRLLAQADLLELRKKQQLFAQGGRDDYTFYVLEGTIEMHADGSLIKRVVGGEAASFQPLAQLQPRQMSAVATGPALVLRLRRSLLEQLLSTDSPPPPPANTVGAPDIEVVEVDGGDDWLVTLLQSDLFTRVPPSNVQTLLDTLESIDASAGEDIVRQGEPGDYYYVIQSGHCEVVRAGARGRPIKLAELGPGDTFGEEALVSDATRNATVRMLSDGALARLTKEDFARLIKAPLLDAVDLAEAERRVAAGARWLDVRFEDEHAHNGLVDSLNIPLGMLRMRMSELDPAMSYVAYCDTGGRSSSAAFLLAGHGFDACYVVDGAVAEQSAQQHAAAPQSTAAVADPPHDTPSPAAAMRSDADATIATARRMMAEAASMKADAERVVREQLDAERERLAAEAARLHDQLAETARVREALEAEREAVGAEREAVSADAARIEADAEERLREAEARAQASMEAERRRLEALYQDQTERLEASRADREAALREQLREELARERRKFEQAFLRATEELEQARVEREAARSAEKSARADAAALQAQFETEQQRLKQAYQAALEQERARLQAEALRLEAQRAEAVQAREAAEAARAEAERALAAARSAAAAATSAGAQRSLDEVEQRASAAQRDLQQARAAESAAAAAAHDNRQELERTYGTAGDIDLLLQRELADWVEEQDRLQQSTQQRDALARQKDMIARIRARADAAREEHASNTRSLLDDIEAQLRGR